MRRDLKRVVVRTSLFYGLLAALWVLLSGGAVVAFIHGPHPAEKVEICRSLAFVVVTSFLLYGVLSRQMRWLEREAEGRTQAEQLVRENHERFLKVFRSSPMGITLSRLSDGRLIEANSAIFRVSGYTREEIVNRDFHGPGLWVFPEERERLVDAVRTDGRVEGFEARFRKKSGEIGTMLGSAELVEFAGESHLLGMIVDITERKRAEEARKASENLYRAIFEHCVASLAILEEDGTMILVNEKLSSVLGYSRGEIEGRMHWTAIAAPEDLERQKGLHEARMADPARAPVEFECKVRRKDGTVVHGIARVGSIPGTTRSIFSGMDVSARRAADEALKESESRFKAAFDTSAMGMALVSLDGKWLRVNKALCRSLGYPEEELLSKTLRDIAHPDDVENDREYARRLVRDDISDYRVEKRYVHKDGFTVWGLLTVSIVRDSLGYPLYFVSQMEDITERKLLEERLRKMLVTDDLTGLYNRRGFIELGEEQIRLARRRKEKLLLFFLDLDDMKRINDTLGHHEGDRALVNVARALKETFRESDIVGRIGGDEFAVLAVEASEHSREAMLSRLDENLARDRGDLSLFVSAGSSEYDPGRPQTTIGALLARADERMYETKQKKKEKAFSAIADGDRQGRRPG